MALTLFGDTQEPGLTFLARPTTSSNDARALDAKVICYVCVLVCKQLSVIGKTNVGVTRRSRAPIHQH